MRLAPRKFRTSRAQKRERVHRLLVLMGVFCGGLLSVLAVGWIARSPQLRISTIVVTGAPEEQSTFIKQHVLEKLRGTVVGVPRDLRPLVRTKPIELSVLAAVPSLREARVHVRDIDTLEVVAVPRTPAGLWCGDVVPPAHEGDVVACYVVDQTGFIYARAQPGELSTLPRLYGALEAGGPIGTTFIHADEFRTYETLWNEASTTGLTPYAVLLVDERDAELTLMNGQVLFERSDGASVSEVLAALYRHGTIDGQTPFSYVDMRFGKGKVYVRRPETADEAATSSAETEM